MFSLRQAKNQNQIGVNLWDIQVKQKGIVSIILPRTKCLLLGPLYFLERELLSKENSGRTIDLDEDREPQDNIKPELEHDQDVHQNVNSNHVQETQVIRRSGRIRH